MFFKIGHTEEPIVYRTSYTPFQPFPISFNVHIIDSIKMLFLFLYVIDQGKMNY